MSYAIVRIQKFGAGAVGGIQIHDRRIKEGISHTNKDIDWDKTHLNYDLLRAEKAQTENKQAETISFHRAIKDRIKTLDLKKAVRKDAVLMVQCLVTSDHDFFENLSPGETQKFFKESYDFLCERYGKENVISSTVHMDETTPHMHFNFVPVTSDGRLSAKSIITRQSLIEQQDLFVYDVGEKYGLKRGQEGGKKVHLEVLDYKLETKKNKLLETEQLLGGQEKQLNTISDDYKKRKRDILFMEGRISDLEAKKQALEQEIGLLEYITLNREEISAIRPKKALTGGLKDITMEEFSSLKSMALESISLKGQLREQRKKYSELDNKTRMSLDTTTQMIDLKRRNMELEKSNKNINAVIGSNPELKNLFIDAQKEFSKKLLTPKKTKGFSL